MADVSLSYEELEALSDVLEAARCFWHSKREENPQYAGSLRMVHQLYWRLGEHLPRTGAPSARFTPVAHDQLSDNVRKVFEFILTLHRDHARLNDPWFADTAVMPPHLTYGWKDGDIDQLRNALARMGLRLEVQPDMSGDEIVVGRRNLGPSFS